MTFIQTGGTLMIEDARLVWDRLKLTVGIGTRISKPSQVVAERVRRHDAGEDRILNDDIREWLDNNCAGLYSYKFNRIKATCDFCFARKSHAVMFKLAW